VVHVELRLLGRFEVVVDGLAVPSSRWSRRSAAGLVKLLALSPGRRLHREQVMDALWPDAPLEMLVPRLHKAAHFARKATAVEGSVVLADDVVALFPEADVDIDVDAFEAAAVHALSTADPADVDAALLLWGGDLLPDVPYEPWAFHPRQRVQLRHRDLLRRAQRWVELVALDPTDEEAHVGIMRELLDGGDRAGVRRQFDLLERTLRDELAIGPSTEAEELRQRAMEGRAPSSPRTTGYRRHSNLGTQSIHFCSTLDGVRLAYALSGDGPALVKASNWLTHLDYDWESPVWSHWWQGLSRHHRLIRYDERGCGLSSWDVDEFTLDAYVRDLETVVDALGLERFPLLGISQGGAIAITYAARHPDRVTSLVLYGTGVRGRRRKAETDAQHRELDALAELMRVSWGADEPGFQRVYNARFMPEGPLEQWRAFDELQKKTASPENAVRLWQSFQLNDVTDAARSLSIPTLILHARDERLRPFADAEQLAELIEGSRLVPLDSPNHILQAGEPAFAEFLDELERFLAGSPIST
jgi:pimeloyl-ACP methyl ester carboxylesterase/DNA-binding SARP family transcriptional activator